MASDIDHLRSLYIKSDTLAAAGDDVVADLRKEINNLELSVLKDYILPKVATLLYKETSDLRCNIDCSLQSIDGKIEYSFCTDNSPLVRASVSEDDNLDLISSTPRTPLNTEILKQLSSSLTRLSELSSEIEYCKVEAQNCVSQLQESTSKVEKQTSSIIEEVPPMEAKDGRILYCRSQTCDAKGRLLPNRDIIVLKGSILRTNATPTYGPKDFRADILAQYCSLTDNGYIALRDLPPMSVSGASGLCLGRSSNGNVDWKDEQGTRLADLS